ncbi:hypothetical protein CVV67_18705 [Arthrobacter stackebrandtii]|nr:hypothetical protein CVV67_18705 [Arthrobacter stackebrandtii]
MKALRIPVAAVRNPAEACGESYPQARPSGVVVTVRWTSLCWHRDHIYVELTAARASQMNLLLRKCRNRLDQRRWVHICVLTN